MLRRSWVLDPASGEGNEQGVALIAEGPRPRYIRAGAFACVGSAVPVERPVWTPLEPRWNEALRASRLLRIWLPGIFGHLTAPRSSWAFLCQSLGVLEGVSLPSFSRFGCFRVDLVVLPAQFQAFRGG